LSRDKVQINGLRCNKLDFKDRLVELMSKNNINNSDLAKIANVSKTTIANYLNGKSEPDVSTLYAISKALNTTTDYLIFGNEEIIDYIEQRLLEIFRSLDEENRLKAVGEIVKLQELQNLRNR